MTTKPSALLLDLDGTLIDTAPDMVAAINRLCTESGRLTLEYENAKPHVSNGSAALVRLAFGNELDAEAFETHRQRFLEIYAEYVCVDSHLFAGMTLVLEHCADRQIPWGIVTNKPGALTVPLVKALGLTTRAACVVSGDTVAKAKPDPMPLFYACEQINVDPQQILYVGDSIRDIQAGNAAGMTTIGATYGYIVDGDNPSDWQADGLITAPTDLLSWLEGTAL
ncbi:MAG: phosphoglycolate phosphatase [Pseudomonadota bacterium]